MALRYYEIAERVGGEGKLAADAALAVIRAKRVWRRAWGKALSLVGLNR